jgi:ABC-type Fe3+/spermidine/putrescine transport system ATPase subunit
MSLVLQQLFQRFGEQVVADHIDLTVGTGQIVALLGASGCGKSSLLKMVAGLLPPISGTILLNQQDISHLPPEKRQMALMFQDFALFPHLNVLDNVAFGLRRQGMAKKMAEQLAHDYLAQVGLADKCRQAVHQLSGGEQQRVALARAMVTSPHALLLDEPFSSLDAHLKGQLQQLVFGQCQEKAIPTLFVTHDKNEALLHADDIAVMVSGKIVQKGTPQTLLTRPQNVTVANLLGCDNVFVDCYIPQSAIRLDYQQGEEVSIVRVDYWVEGVAVCVLWRERNLVLRLSTQEWLLAKDYTVGSNLLKISVDLSLCVPFGH